MKSLLINNSSPNIICNMNTKPSPYKVNISNDDNTNISPALTCNELIAVIALQNIKHDTITELFNDMSYNP
jgi:hypothetical protein